MSDVTSEGATQPNPPGLEITLSGGYLPVSSLSSLLRSVQAAVREAARTNTEANQVLSQPPQPVLVVSMTSRGDDLILSFTFASTPDARPMPRLSELAFGAFLREFNELFKKLPQRGLWGQSVGGSAKGHPQSDVSRRLDQVRSELRRFPRAGIRFAGRTILIEGERLEIV